MKNRIREFRFKDGQITQQQLANAVGVSRQTIIAIEKGNYQPSVKLALKLARYFGVRVEDLFQLEEEE